MMEYLVYTIAWFLIGSGIITLYFYVEWIHRINTGKIEQARFIDYTYRPLYSGDSKFFSWLAMIFCVFLWPFASVFIVKNMCKNW